MRSTAKTTNCYRGQLRLHRDLEEMYGKFLLGKLIKKTCRSAKVQGDSKKRVEETISEGSGDYPNDVLVNKHLIFYLYLFIIICLSLFICPKVRNGNAVASCTHMYNEQFIRKN